LLLFLSNFNKVSTPILKTHQQSLSYSQLSLSRCCVLFPFQTHAAQAIDSLRYIFLVSRFFFPFCLLLVHGVCSFSEAHSFFLNLNDWVLV
jgi:predicted component of type VI protein secretion system